ncbi:MAG: DUF4282 domain-containing protein [Actinobacteria bacterium]|nr:DUF4282 domain-containing protein [Actinomycetota bacterium]MCL6105083.1 DUF4282 domain-containing protein [Actinomycetota bacterium]
MSDVSQGPGWWQAADGKWYPPEAHPDPGYSQKYGSQPSGFVGPPSAQFAGNYGAAYPQSPAHAYLPMGSKGFLTSMFDLSFDNFIFPKIAAVLLVVVWALEILLALVYLVIMVAKGPPAGVILAVLILVIGLPLEMIFTRVSFEFVVAVIKVAENTAHLKQDTQQH